MALAAIEGLNPAVVSAIARTVAEYAGSAEGMKGLAGLEAGYQYGKRIYSGYKKVTEGQKSNKRKKSTQDKMAGKKTKKAKNGPGSGHTASRSQISNATGVSISGGRVSKVGMKKKKGNKSKGLITNKINRLAKTVRKLNKHAAKTFLVVRSSLSTAAYTSLVNKCAYTSFDLLTKTQMEYAATNMVKQIGKDQAASPSTVVETLDIAAASLHNPSVRVKMTKQLKIKNNAYSGAHINLLWLKCIHDTTATSVSELTANATERGMTNGETDVCYYASDFELLSWKSYKNAQYYLMPGDELEIFMQGTAVWDPDMEDQVTKTYVSGKSRQLLMRVQGCVGHDSTTTTAVGIVNTILDVVGIDRTFVKTPGPVKATNYSQNNSFGTLTTPTLITRAMDKESTGTN